MSDEAAQTPVRSMPDVSRRDMLLGSFSWGAVFAVVDLVAQVVPARAGDPTQAEPFTEGHVLRLAEQLAAGTYERPRVDVPDPFKALTAQQYQDIRFKPEAAIWRQDALDYEVQLLPVGWLYDAPVDVWIVEAGNARKLQADNSNFNVGPSIGTVPMGAPFAASGFRLHGAINRADVNDDFASFQGASYFKAIGRGEQFGLAARGLAINTARPGGEEFPLFRAFWVEKPLAHAPAVVVHALLDSQSITGAYRFTIRPGEATVMDVQATLFPRRVLAHVGIAPLTSMFLHGAAHRRIGNDVRPAVHNSEGLAVLNGHGERLWRPLTNPKMLQTSAFVDKDLKGFGLVQRSRELSDYEDLDTRFDLRPTAWIEPKGAWGDGYVELIEIPVTEEIHDNIVAYWKPAAALEPGKSYKFDYAISWAASVPVVWAGARAVKTLIGSGRRGDNIAFYIDFAGAAVADLRDLPSADLAVSAGVVEDLVVQKHPELPGVRVRFELNSGGNDLIELRLGLKLAGQLISENWLYRWTRA